MKMYLSGSIADVKQAEANRMARSLPTMSPPTPRSGDDRDRLLRLVVPDTLQSDVYITITLRWKEDIREWGVLISGSGITSTGEDYIGVFSDTWGNAWIAKQGKENR
ncbi:hypothetical protein PHMEG_00030786 [Phytophthora megakarya]|uniref:Uncharacterized protein n=1 Tax=Phytophthora megakarya TaxID=4795 RepID=A0A225V201_9STRA|nr:hypothetical protein PHMEG_00030786 [Phytophthora megakarya]